VKDGLAQTVVLWKPADLGYLAVQAAHALIKGTLNAGDTNFNAARLGTLEIKGDHIVLGKVLLFNKDNIDRFDF
jgi:ABC-type sugar transport system substrate-binding protein